MKKLFLAFLCLFLCNIYAQEEGTQESFDTKTYVTNPSIFPYLEKCSAGASTDQSKLNGCVDAYFRDKISIRHTGSKAKVYVVMQISEEGKAKLVSVKGEDTRLLEEVKKVGESLPTFVPAKKNDNDVAVELYFILRFSDEKEKELTEEDTEITTAPIFKTCTIKKEYWADQLKSCLDRHIFRHFRYPEQGKKNNIQGKVTVFFTITEDARIEIKAITGAHFTLKDEAERIFKLLEVETPPIKNGKFTSVSFAYPINFKLTD